MGGKGIEVFASFELYEPSAYIPPLDGRLFEFSLDVCIIYICTAVVRHRTVYIYI